MAGFDPSIEAERLAPQRTESVMTMRPWVNADSGSAQK